MCLRQTSTKKQANKRVSECYKLQQNQSSLVPKCPRDPFQWRIQSMATNWQNKTVIADVFFCAFICKETLISQQKPLSLYRWGPEVATSWLTAHWKQIERANNSRRVIASTCSLFLLLAEPLYTPALGCWVCWCVSQVFCRLIFIVFRSVTEPLLHLPAMFGLQMVRLPALRRLCARLSFQF